MLKGLIGQKLNMSQVYDKHGRVMPVTKVTVKPNVVVQIKTSEKDGYKAAQIGSDVAKKPIKPASSHAKKAGLELAPKILLEVAFDGNLKNGDQVTVDQVFRKGSLVDVVGVSKGKGFAGVVKRWGFAGGPRTHGQSDRERAPGSIGATTTPGRVFKGLKMAGHMGNKRVTIQGLEIMELDQEKSQLLLRGSIPGYSGSYLLIKKSSSKKKAYHEPEIPQVPVVTSQKEEAEEEATETPKIEQIATELSESKEEAQEG